ncbi:thioredoxin [Maribacter sedimenticola]|uniref:Thioredoxin n=1 Tax=Maribacter sedimenticola TaxID=228956 RepID=A0ABY1SF74_9FLAO|nr:thioredoxin family protein [Maribacter sedimenticola]SNR40656.1 thioredoxin [Maribacter sedimenticola]
MGFRKEISSEVPTLVHFFAPWCLPCKTMSAMLHTINKEVQGLFNILEIDVDVKKKLGRRYTVKSVPTLLLFKNGEPLWRHVGMLEKVELKKIISELT